MRGRVFYQARPKIMALTDDKELNYNYFSQTLLPDYIEENGLDWDVVYDARGHFEEPHTNRDMGCSTIEVRDYLDAVKDPEVTAADFAEAGVDVVGPNGGYAGILFCEKEGFGPLFKSVDLANRYDLMIISSKGVSVTAARRLIDEVCGENNLPLFVLHDFDVAGFLILGTLQPRHAALHVRLRDRSRRLGPSARRRTRPRKRAGRREQDRQRTLAQPTR